MHPHSTSDHFARRALVTYIHTAQRAASEVIRSYSTSFFAATHLLGRRNRQHIRNLYALVRVADELVDGVSAAAGLIREAQLAALDQFETATLTAMRTGYSTDLVIQAFAHTARTANISADLVAPFFASMRTDLLEAPGRPGPDGDQAAAGGVTAVAGGDTAAAGVRTYDGAAHAQYVYGSAEVVGLMCLRIFLRGQAVNAKELAQMETGARQLGAALQNINFLRDISVDTVRLRRHYLGTVSELTPDIKARWVAVAQEQLDEAQAAFPLLPSDARRAVYGVHGLFSELLARIAAADCEELHRRRIRVPDSRKARILGQALLFDSGRKLAK